MSQMVGRYLSPYLDFVILKSVEVITNKSFHCSLTSNIMGKKVNSYHATIIVLLKQCELWPTESQPGRTWESRFSLTRSQVEGRNVCWLPYSIYIKYLFLHRTYTWNRRSIENLLGTHQVFENLLLVTHEVFENVLNNLVFLLYILSCHYTLMFHSSCLSTTFPFTHNVLRPVCP